MDCLRCRTLLSPLMDGELPADQAAAVQAHLQHCAACAAGLSVLQALQAGLRAHPPVPPDLAPLAARVRAGLPQRPAARPAAASRGPLWLWPALGTGLVAALAASALTLLLAHPGPEEGLEDVASASYLRATRLTPAHLQGLASTDPAQVQAWLQGHMGQAVPVPAVAPPGFALAGARVDYLYRQSVAALVYQQGPHRVEVYLWPQGQEPALRAAADEDALRIRFWSRGGLHRCAITDLDAAALARFVAGFSA
jgi:anti-sigma factor RsiW